MTLPGPAGPALVLAERRRACTAPRSSTPTPAACSARSPRARRASASRSCRCSRRTTARSTCRRRYYSRGGTRRAHRRRDGLRRASTLRPSPRSSSRRSAPSTSPATRRAPSSDDGRFVAVFNLTPATSLSIVDVRARRFVGRGPDARLQPGVRRGPAALLHAVRRRRGARGERSTTAGRRSVAAQRRASSIRRRIPSPRRRSGAATSGSSSRSTAWCTRSTCPARRSRFGEPWSLFDDADRAASWRIGGGSTLAVHARRPDGSTRSCTRAAPTRTRRPARRCGCTTSRATQRVQRIAMLNPLVELHRACRRPSIATARRPRRAAGSSTRCCRTRASERILVTQDAHPVLVASASLPPTVTVHDALTGAVLREVSEPGIAASLLVATIGGSVAMDPVIDLDAPRRAGARCSAVARGTSCATRVRFRDASSATIACCPARARRRRARSPCWSPRSGGGRALPVRRRAAAAPPARRLLAVYARGDRASTCARGRRDIDCGCGGPAARQPISDGLVGAQRGARSRWRSRRAAARRRARRSSGSTRSPSRRRSRALALPLRRDRPPARARARASRALGGARDARRCSSRTSSSGSRSCVLAAVVVALVRQIGVLYERVAPAGALMVGDAARRSARRRRWSRSRISRARSHASAAPRDDGRSTLLFFVSPTCPVCKTLLPVAALARAPRERGWLDVVLASDGAPRRARGLRARASGSSAFAYVLSTALGIDAIRSASCRTRCCSTRAASCARRGS